MKEWKLGDKCGFGFWKSPVNGFGIMETHDSNGNPLPPYKITSAHITHIAQCRRNSPNDVPDFCDEGTEEAVCYRIREDGTDALFACWVWEELMLEAPND